MQEQDYGDLPIDDFTHGLYKNVENMKTLMYWVVITNILNLVYWVMYASQ